MAPTAVDRNFMMLLIQFPTDDGTCRGFSSEQECRDSTAPIDRSVYLCEWTPSEVSSGEDPSGICSSGNPSFSLKVRLLSQFCCCHFI